MFKIQNYHWIKKMRARHEVLSLNHQDTHYQSNCFSNLDDHSNICTYTRTRLSGPQAVRKQARVNNDARTPKFYGKSENPLKI